MLLFEDPSRETKRKERLSSEKWTKKKNFYKEKETAKG